MIEGREAFKRFKNTMKAVLSVSHEELQKRIDAEKEKSAMNPNRRGPKTSKRAPSNRNSKLPD